MKRIIAVLISLVIAACASSPKTNTSQAPQENTQQPATEVSTVAAPSAAELELKRLTAELEQLQKQSDYFDYNKSTIKPEYQSIIQKQAEFLKTHTNDIVTLEGNADERGGDAYNMSLGEKRAAAVQQSLVMHGVSAKQIRLVSLGKSKPRLTCHDETCWKENRRVDFIHML